jgi:hypothetical protein
MHMRGTKITHVKYKQHMFFLGKMAEERPRGEAGCKKKQYY